MATKTAKKAVKKVSAKSAEKKDILEKVAADKADKYFYAIGKRKTAIAQVRIYPVNKEKEEIKVNNKAIGEYFSIDRLQAMAKAPLVMTGNEEKFNVMAKIIGGGINGQAEAMRLGIARAMVKFDETLKKQLRDLGYLTRDARVVERKKPGLKKARRAPQWAKR